MSHRQHLYKILHEDLPLCGCGNPEDAYTLVRELLALAPFYDREHGEVAALIGSSGAYQIVLGALTEADLIEHGGAMGGSWLTTKGQWCLTALRGEGDLEELREAGDFGGLPHHGEDCTDSCWATEAP